MLHRAWTSILLGFILAVSGTYPAQAEPKALSILRVTPTGEDVPAGNQIVIEFNRPVVPVGKMERTAAEVGVEISPALNCQWRWLNTSTLSCNLDGKDAMTAATRYTLTIQPQIMAEDGAKIAEAQTYDFTTIRPDVSYTGFQTWRGPASPVIRVVFNQPIARSSVEKHLYIEGAGKRYDLTVTPEETAEKIPDYLYVPGEKAWVATNGEERKISDRLTSFKGEEARSVWLVEPKEILAEGATASLKLEPGLISALGPEPSIKARDIVSFDTFPTFAFAGIRCTDNQGSELIIKPDMQQTEAHLCNPLRAVSLMFTAPVLRSQVKDAAAFSPDLAGGRKDFNPWGDENRDWTSLGSPHRQGNMYYVGLPFGLKAAQTYTVSLPGPLTWLDKLKNIFRKTKIATIEDEMGRTLATPIQFSFSTNHRNPNFEMPLQDAVLESGIDSDLPLYVNNLTKFGFDYNVITPSGVKTKQTYSRDLNKLQDIQYGVPAGVREMLGSNSGAIFGILSTAPEVPDKWDGAYRLFAQVTPWQAHLKLGHYSSLIWVTDLATGRPVADVKIRIYTDSFTSLSQPGKPLAIAITDAQGLAVLPGTERLDPNQEMIDRWKDEDERLFVRLDKGHDMALLPVASAFSLSTWSLSEDGTGSWNRDKYGHMKSWGFTAQGIYRAGDTMQYKIFLRDQTDQALTSPPKGDYKLQILDPTGKTVDEIKGITFSEFGAYSGEYVIPETAPVGWYNFKLQANFTGEQDKTESGEEQSGDYSEKGRYTLHPLRVLVSDFTPAPFRVTTELGGDLFRPEDTMSIETKATLHSGGAYGDASARVTVTLRQRTFTSENPAAKNFTFGSGDLSDDQLLQKSETLNDKGEWIESFKVPEHKIYYGSLEVESAVQDDRGKSVASMASAQYAGVNRYVGLRSPQWFYDAKKPVTLQTLVVDEQGVPVADSKINVLIEREEIDVAKVKGAGNAYLSDVTREWKKAASCDIVSTADAKDCTFTPAGAGSYRAIATIQDTKGREHKTELSLWVSGDDYVQWNDQDNLILPVIPEKKDYKVGDTARFLVKNPYPGASALITVERYGILDRFVQNLEGSAPVIEIPVKGDYLPGFYLSIMIVSPRVDQPPPALGQIDMGKPAFRMGYVTVPVRDPYKDIVVTTTVAQDVYRPRDTVKIELQAQPRHAPSPAEPIELAVAVLDESVFDLIADGKTAFDPYAGFYELDPLDMRNYSLLYRLAGRQKFEKKGANPGGDGGADLSMRTLFKYVSYWNPSVKTDATGKAEIEFQAPDNLTGWRILTIATTPTDRMGLGEGTFKVNRPTELRPVMPNQVREDDSFTAGFSVMNRTDKARTIKVSIEAAGDLTKPETITKEVTLEPYKRSTVYLPLKAGLLPVVRENAKGAIGFTVKAQDAGDGDAMEYTLPVLKKRVISVGATYGTSTEDQVQESIAVPAGIYTDSGDLSVVVSPSVIANISGAFRYMRDYEYPCWEQLLTRGVMAAHYNELQPWLPQSLTWADSKTLPRETMEKAANFQAPNGGMSYFIASDSRADPYLSAYTAIAFSWLKKDGYAVPEEVERKLHQYLLTFLRQDVAPDFYQAGMVSSVRAVALAALAEEGKISADDVLRYRPHLKEMNLFGKAHFMQAALQFDATRSAAKDAVDMIFATANETGGKFMFSETLDNGYARLLSTPLRENCAILSAFLRYKAKGGEELIGDKPFKLVRMISQSRGSRDYWENTQENMFCMNGLIEYARAYEQERPRMKLTAATGPQSLGTATFTDLKDPPVTLERSLQDSDAGQKQTLTLTREGQGRYYYATRLRYAEKSLSPDSVNAGMDIQREYSIKKGDAWTLLKDTDAIKRGDTVRVDLYLSLPAPRNFVVVNDPVPGGLETVNRDLATASGVDADQAGYDEAGGSIWFKYGEWTEYNASFWSFYHRELRHDSARFYADWLPAGNYHLSYMTQAIADGVFAAPPVRAEEMYDPDVYGRGHAASLTVQEAP